MLELVARHGGFNLDIRADGNLDVNQRQRVKNLVLALGEAVSKALGTRRGINRAGYFIMPMDETLAVAAIDLGGRPHAGGRVPVLKVARVGDLQSELVTDFFEGFALGVRGNVHVKVLYGRSSITTWRQSSRHSRARCGLRARETGNFHGRYPVQKDC